MTSYKAKHLPAHRGPAAWNAILPGQPPDQVLESDLTADFVIVGAGFAGLSAARRLKQLQPQARVVVLEAGRIAEGASGRNSGFMIDLPHELTSEDYAGSGDDKSIIALNRQAISYAGDAVEEYEIDPNYFDKSGKINGAVSSAADKHNLTYSRHLTSLGEASEMLDEKQMFEVSGSKHYRSGLYTAGTAMLQPTGYIRGLAKGLRERDVKIFENSPVTEFTNFKNGWTVQTPKASISTGRIILTVNGHLESFGIERGRLMQIFLYASMTQELDKDTLAELGGNPRWGITPSDPMGTTMRRIDTAQGGNRIITRTCATLAPNMQVNEIQLNRAARVHQKKFDQRFPQLSGMEMEYKWAGHLCLTQNGSSVTRQIDEGIFSACVQNGLGTARGTLTGIAAAELACGETSNITAHFVKENRPAKLPPQPFLSLGANATIRYKEWRARDE